MDTTLSIFLSHHKVVIIIIIITKKVTLKHALLVIQEVQILYKFSTLQKNDTILFVNKKKQGKINEHAL